MAFANPHITADAVDAQEFMDLSRRYRVTGVPKTIVNDDIEALEARWLELTEAIESANSVA